MKAVILAAGFGTRLWPLTEDRTKPAIPFLNRPLIGYSVDYLASHGITDIVVNLHHQPESIRQALCDGSEIGVSITYSFEETILGTSGALDLIRDSLIDDDFVVINGKIVTDIDLQAALQSHREKEAIATLVLRHNAEREHFSIVEVDEASRVSKFAGFPELVAEAAMREPARAARGVVRQHGEAAAPLMFTGIQILSPRIFDYVPRHCFSHSTIHVYPRAIEAGETVFGHIAHGDWYEMSTLDRYLEASLIFMNKHGQSITTGTGCSIHEAASVEESVLWNNVTVEKDAKVRQTVLGDGVRITSGQTVERAVVVRRERIQELERGEVVGENVVVPLVSK
jgi:NDP-sugar pyrophosphorylase family protein